MKLYFFLILFLLLFSIYTIEENSIIKIPNKEGRFENIQTRKGPINYEFGINWGEEFQVSFPYIEYKLEGIKEINNKGIYQIMIEDLKADSGNKRICEMFYEYNYIDKLIYSIDQKYKYFGGLPKYLDKLEKFNFNDKNENITEINIELNNGTKFTKRVNYKYRFLESEPGLINVPDEIMSLFSELFL